MSGAALTREFIGSLERAVGRENVFHRPEELIVWEYDSTIERALPGAVVLPASTEEVSAVVRLAHQAGVPVTPRGAGTGLSGGSVPEGGGVVIALTRMNRVLEIDPRDRIAVVEPGVVNLELTKATSPHGLYYAPDPSSQRACTVGGNVAENAGGPHCLAYGVTTNHILGLQLVLADGRIVWTGGRARDLPGYDLTGLMVGSEGTLAIVTRIVVRLLRFPEFTRTLLAIFDEVDQASNVVSGIIARGIIPAALEMMDREIIRAVEPALHVGYPMDAGAVLLIELDGLRESVVEQSEVIRSLSGEGGAREVRVADEAAERERLWAGRKGSIGALGRLMPNFYVLDGVVPRTRLPEVLAQVYELGERTGFVIANVFHAGDGNLHPNILFDGRKPGETQRALEAGAEIMRLCVAAGGSITGEHGIGLEKRDFMPWLFSEDDMEAMWRVRRAFGAEELFNPCKAFPAGAGCGELSSFTYERLSTSMGPDIYV